MKREKRLKKGIGSLKKQVEIHEQKLDIAVKEGDPYLSDYYAKEIAEFEKRIEDRKSKLKRGEK